MADFIKRAAEDIARAKNIVALTGAGISVESGIPPFRGKGGIWEKFDPMEYAHIDAFLSNPAKVWQVLVKALIDVIGRAKPNDAHTGLARLERMGKLTTVITQNVDGLHQAAGNTDVIEYHGSFARLRCLACRTRCESATAELSRIPPRCACGGILRPECIFFGEMIAPEHLMRSGKAAGACDLMLVVGTSAVVYPAAGIPEIARNAGAKVIEINPEKTELTGSISDYLIRGPAGRVMQQVLEQLERLLQVR